VPSFASLFDADSSGVIRIDGTTCSGGSIGTGFLIGPDLVATVAHVVDGAGSIVLRGPSSTRTGVVIGIDTARDLALVRASSAFNGHVFTLSPDPPGVGTPVGAIGFPEGLPVTFTAGSVSGLDRTIQIDSVDRTGLLQTDAAVNPGNSGGPLLTVDGDVVGLVDAGAADLHGISFAVSASTATGLFATWSANPQASPPPSCAAPVGPAAEAPTLTPPPGQSAASGIAATLTTYFAAINRADWATAWAQFTPAEQQTLSQAKLESGDASSFDFNFNLVSVVPTGPTAATATLIFTSVQGPAYGPNGETCDTWTLDYSMMNLGGTWLIASVNGAGGGPTHTTC
jgi:hypothetical protein